MARPQEIDEKHRWGGTIRALVLFALTVGVVGYLVFPGRHPQAPPRNVEAFCAQMATVAPFDQALAQLDPTAVRNAIPDLERLELTAPPEIISAVQVIVETSRSLVTPVQDAQSDESAPDKAWRAKQADVGRIESAGKSLHAYTLTNCKLDLSTTIPPPPPSTTSTAAPTTVPAKSSKPAPTVAPSTVAPSTVAPKASPTTTAKKPPPKTPTTTTNANASTTR